MIFVKNMGIVGISRYDETARLSFYAKKSKLVRLIVDFFHKQRPTLLFCQTEPATIYLFGNIVKLTLIEMALKFKTFTFQDLELNVYSFVHPQT